MRAWHPRPDVVSIQENRGADVCCGHRQLFVEYADEPVWSYLICPFCGATIVCNLMVPDAVRRTFCDERFERDSLSAFDDLLLFEKMRHLP